MRIKTPTPTEDSSPGAIAPLVASWKRSLAARRITRRRSRPTARRALLLADFLAANEMPTDVAGIRREHVESFVADLLARRAPATVRGATA
jgi:hypothetical protein